MAQTSLDKAKIKILLLEGVHQSAVDTFKHAGYSNIEYHKGSLPKADLLASIKDAHFVGIRSRTNLTAEVFDAAEKLVAVGCFCIGTNQVDLKAATKHGVPVFNAPYSNTRSVAELVLAETIMLLRGVPHRSAAAHRGEWLKNAVKSYEARGKTLGIVGYGNIGAQVSVLAESIGMNVQFYDIVPKLPMGNANQVESMEKLLATSDVISLHVPETASTKWMMGKEQFAQMKDGSIFINAARGTCVDIDALCEVMESGKLLGTAIDVFPVEPRSADEEFESPLRKFDNAILTPHVGGSTQEAQLNIGIEVADKLAAYSDNGTTLSSVNFPEVALPAHGETHRILHIHENRPGVISEINKAFSDNGFNIAGQYLQTNEEVGYVVIDVDKACSGEALDKIRTVPGTLKARILF